MSKELEALKRLWEETKGNSNTSSFSNRSDYDKIREALKRNDPMKITQTSNEQDFSLFDCPNCDTTMYYESEPEDWKYCIECGQALDWETN